jgi:hypothetical protein
MIELLPLAVAGFVGFSVGGAGVYALGKRKATTKADLLRGIAKEAELVLDMKGAEDDRKTFEAKVKSEADAKAELAAVLAKASGG